MKLIAMKLISSKTGESLVTQIWHQPPARRLIQCASRRYFLSFPHLIFRSTVYDAARISPHQRLGFGRLGREPFISASFAVVMSTTPSSREDTLVFAPTLPNLHCGSICLGDKVFAGKTPDDVSREAAAGFWTRKFHAGDREVLSRWERWTRDDPNWVPAVEHLPHLGRVMFFKNWSAAASTL